MAMRFKMYDFTEALKDERTLILKDRKIWLTGYGFVKYVRLGQRTFAIYERGADYSDCNIK